MQTNRSRLLPLLVLLASISLPAAAASLRTHAEAAIALHARSTSDVAFDESGRVTDASHIRIARGVQAEAIGSSAVALRAVAPLLFGDVTPDLRVERINESLTGTHVLYRQYVDGLPVVDGGVWADADGDGDIVELHNRVASDSAGHLSPIVSSDPAAAFIAAHRVRSRERVIVNAGGVARRAWRVIVADRALEPWAHYLDANTGEWLRSDALFYNAQGRVFDVNPVAQLNAPSLQDGNDAAGAVPEAAYSTVELPELAPSGMLSGPNVRIVDDELPSTAHADAAASLMFDRSQPQFEEVNAYFQIDRAQRYLQSLGYVGSRGVVAYPLPVDAHAANGTDNSYYLPSSISGRGELYFGDGGTDDAEDPDIMLHEFGHAIQDWIAPGAFGGESSGQPRALGEGFGDYWSFSSTYEKTIASGRDAFCIADWDARCGSDDPSEQCSYAPLADCLRRVDGSKTMADYLLRNSSGTEHQNGEIWSSALREIFMALTRQYGLTAGKRMADTIVIEGHFGTPPNPTFAAMGRKLLDADRLLNGAANAAVICSAMTSRGILAAADCNLAPHGELTAFQSGDAARAIPDNDSAGIVSTLTIADPRSIDAIYVSVDAVHPIRGDLRIVLTAPDGTRITLQDVSNDKSPDLHVTYGLDAQPLQSLDVLHGKAANGTWTLTVSDVNIFDTGYLARWGLLIHFVGDTATSTRPVSAATRRVISGVAHAIGAAGTFFISDVRLLNRSSSEAHVTAVFTPGGTDGTTSFSALKLVIAAGQTLALDDVVARSFHLSGVGALEFQGDVAPLIVTSRTYNQTGNGTFGQFIEGVASDQAAGSEAGAVFVTQLQNDADFRSNLGFAETAGSSGVVRVESYDAAHTLLATNDYDVLPFEQLQVPLLGGLGGTRAAAFRAEVRVISGSARVLAYGSVIDNHSGDPIYVPARHASTEATREVIAAVIHAPGAADTNWRSDVWFTNTAAASDAAATFYPTPSGTALLIPVNLPAMTTLAIDDFVGTTVGAIEATGMLLIDAPAHTIVTSRSWTPTTSGSYGQFIEALPVTSAVGAGTSLDAIQLESSSAYRANIGIAEVTGNDVTVRFTLHDAGGAVLQQWDLPLAGLRQRQFSLTSFYTPVVINGRVTMQVIGGSGRIVGYASVIDNRSNDPIYVPAR